VRIWNRVAVLAILGWASCGLRADDEQKLSRDEASRQVLDAIVQAARKHAGRKGDALTGYYVRESADAALRLPSGRADAFLLALGVGMDDSDLLRKNLVTRETWLRLEPEAAFKKRVALLGSPTMRGRRDWCQHFWVSCALTVLGSPRAAESAGILKEQLDSRPGGSGFSFDDLCADFAGIAFAKMIQDNPKTLTGLAREFRVPDYLPDPKDLPTGLSREEFGKRYGSVTDERFRDMQMSIWKRVLALPAYADAYKGKEKP
jgi:hypothetical protein